MMDWLCVGSRRDGVVWPCGVEVDELIGLVEGTGLTDRVSLAERNGQVESTV